MFEKLAAVSEFWNTYNYNGESSASSQENEMETDYATMWGLRFRGLLLSWVAVKEFNLNCHKGKRRGKNKLEMNFELFLLVDVQLAKA